MNCEICADWQITPRTVNAGRWPTPRSTAEEMALHLAIEDAPTCLELDDDSDDDGHEALPKHPDDYTWDDCSEYLFQDHYVLMLFDEDLTGITDPASAASQFGVTVDPPHRSIPLGGAARRCALIEVTGWV
jgi:hypothetical protein